MNPDNGFFEILNYIALLASKLVRLKTPSKLGAQSQKRLDSFALNSRFRRTRAFFFKRFNLSTLKLLSAEFIGPIGRKGRIQVEGSFGEQCYKAKIGWFAERKRINVRYLRDGCGWCHRRLLRHDDSTGWNVDQLLIGQLDRRSCGVNFGYF